MVKRQLGNSDLMITPLGVGAWAMGGGGWQFAWGPQDDSESMKAIHAALDAGWNWIDTAAVYGLGHSEEIVGKTIREHTDKPYVFTKCARIWGEDRKIAKSLKADSVRRECEASLRRLGVEVIDLYQIHWPEPDEDVEEGWSTLARLKEEGKVRWIGVSNFTVAQVKRAQAIAPVTSAQPPYSAASPEAEAEILAALPGDRRRCDCVLANEIGAAHRKDDTGADRQSGGGRFPAQGAGVSGTAADPEPAVGGVTGRDRKVARHDCGRSGDHLDPAASRIDGCDCRIAVGGAIRGRPRSRGETVDRG